MDHDREPSPSEAIIDSQSVKSAAMVSQAVGYDAGKRVKGRKRFLTVDTLGLVLRVLITAANVGGAKAENKCYSRSNRWVLPCHASIRSGLMLVLMATPSCSG